MANKTAQAIKVSAVWTPNEETSRDMLNSIFEASDESTSEGVKVSGGKLSLRVNYPAKLDDAKAMGLLQERLADLKSMLSSTGTLHSFETKAGAVPVGELTELLDTEAPEL